MYAFQELKAQAIKAVEQALGEKILPSDVSMPPSQELGDLSIALFRIAKEKKENPAELAEKAASMIKPNGLMAKAEAKGPYLNFFADYSSFSEKVIKQAQEEKYGSTGKGTGKKVVMDYSHPNICKPLHVGHLPSTVLGESIKRILKHHSYDVFAVNHLGDWGLQFGKLILAYKLWGNEQEFKKDPLKHLTELYVKFHEEEEKQPELKEKAEEILSSLEKGDKELLSLWEKFREESIKEFNEMYSILGVSFDSYKGEAYYVLSGKAKEVIKEALEKGIAVEEKPGTVIVPLEDYGLTNARLVENNRTLYITRDIAAAIDRYEEHNFSKMLYVVSSAQSLHFQQLFKTLELMGYKWSKNCEHVKFGTVLLEGKKMSTRKGQFVPLSEVIEKTKQAAEETIKEKNPGLVKKEETALQIALTALKFSMLSMNREKDKKFHLEKITSFEGDTGPYVQYSHVRCNGIIKNTHADGEPDYSKLTSVHEKQLVKQLSLFPGIVEKAEQELDPHVIAQYLLKLCHLFSAFYENCPVANVEDQSLKAARLELVKAVKNTLAVGMKLLTITPLEEM